VLGTRAGKRSSEREKSAGPAIKISVSPSELSKSKIKLQLNFGPEFGVGCLK
jgi:hypothetical protein